MQGEGSIEPPGRDTPPLPPWDIPPCPQIYSGADNWASEVIRTQKPRKPRKWHFWNQHEFVAGAPHRRHLSCLSRKTVPLKPPTNKLLGPPAGD